MAIASDPKADTLPDSDDAFGKYFEGFASGSPLPEPEAPADSDAPEGNDPAADAPAPAPAATEETEAADDVTSGNAGPEGAAAPEGEQAPDPWANVPDDLRERIKQIEKERDEARHKAQSDANRVAALSRKLQQLTVAPPASAPKAPAAEPSEAQKALDAKIKTLREDYGDIAEPLIELIESQKQELNTVRATLDGLSEERQAQVIAVERQALEERHPDWQNIAQSPDFAGWLEAQPENIQRLASSWDARETSVVLTLFKAEASPSQTAAPATVATQPKADAATGARRSQQLEGGRDVRSRPAPAASGPPEDFDAAFAFFEAQRQEKLKRA